jgi:hypothetical protein
MEDLKILQDQMIFILLEKGYECREREIINHKFSKYMDFPQICEFDVKSVNIDFCEVKIKIVQDYELLDDIEIKMNVYDCDAKIAEYLGLNGDINRQYCKYFRNVLNAIEGIESLSDCKK